MKLLNSFKIYGTKRIQTIVINKSEVGWEKTCVPKILLKPNILGQPLGSRKRVTVLRDGLGIRPQIGRELKGTKKDEALD